MTHTLEMLRTHPQAGNAPMEELARRVEACYDCAQACTSCADACLGEDMVAELVRCIRLNLDCASICQATGAVLSRQTEPEMSVIRAQLEACIAACRVCAQECESHADMHEHCRVCAEACRACEEACHQALAAIGR
jgi:hypothetical protein